MGKVILVSGASSGIGKATARMLAEAGYKVYCAARRTGMMEELKKYGAFPLYMDVTDDGSMIKAVDEIINAEGRIDVLVNSAGYGIYGTIEDIPISDAKSMFDVNVFGLARLTQLVLPHMRKERNSMIVNISSIAGRISIPMGAWYHASKHAVEALSDSLRLEVEPFGIDVVIIEPGIIETDMWPETERYLEKVSAGSVYSNLVEKGKRYIKNPGKSSKPEVIAGTIKKAIEARRPKIRYVAGASAKRYIRARKLLPDRMFDRLIKKTFKLDY